MAFDASMELLVLSSRESVFEKKSALNPNVGGRTAVRLCGQLLMRQLYPIVRFSLGN